MSPFFKGYMKLYLHDKDLDNLIDRCEFYEEWETKVRRIFNRNRRFKVGFYFYDSEGYKRWHENIQVTDKANPIQLSEVVYQEGKRIGSSVVEHFKEKGEDLSVDFTRSYAVVRA